MSESLPQILLLSSRFMSAWLLLSLSLLFSRSRTLIIIIFIIILCLLSFVHSALILSVPYLFLIQNWVNHNEYRLLSLTCAVYPHNPRVSINWSSRNRSFLFAVLTDTVPRSIASRMIIPLLLMLNGGLFSNRHRVVHRTYGSSFQTTLSFVAHLNLQLFYDVVPPGYPNRSTGRLRSPILTIWSENLVC